MFEITLIQDGKPIKSEKILFLNDKQQLHIESPTENDAGRYSCIAENKPGRAEKDLIVTVLRPPEMLENNRVFEVLENDTQSLECPITDPTVEIQWFKNDVPITMSPNLQLSTSGHKIHIMHGQVSDSGRYTCRASNDAGQAFSNMDVVVLVPPKIIAPSLRQLEAVIGQTVEIECKTTGTPQPQIIWSFDGKIIFESERVEFLNNGSVLRLNDVQGNQEGRYTCTSENTVGKTEADSFLRVNVPPKIVTPSDDMKVIEGQSQTIRCEVIGSPSPQIEWLKNGQKFESPMVQSSNNLHYIHFREATVEDAGRYTCIAINRAGEQRITVQLRVLVPATIANGERVVQVKENTVLSLLCQASGNPSPKISWKRDGVLLESVVGPRLTIESPKATDAGRYTCEALNEAGKASADFEVDVFIKPRFKDLVSDIRVKEGDRTRLECKVDGHPTPTIMWLRGGRPIETMHNFILSPRGETLMILKAKRTDAGSYSCVAKNFAGESEASFKLTVLVAPYIEEAIDQNPRVVFNQTITLHCPVLGIPKPTVEWRYKNEPIIGGRFKTINGYDLQIEAALESDAGRYTCYAENEAGDLSTDFELEVIGPPKWSHDMNLEYEVLIDETVTMDCSFSAEPKPKIMWYHGDSPLYLSANKQLSPDMEQLTIRGAQLADGGKYTCKATNKAGSSEVDIQLRVLVPPKIDRSNIIGNPLAIAGRSIYLECPVTGIPQPSVQWFREGDPMDLSNPRFSLNENNQTFGIKDVAISDEGRYFCLAKNKGGTAEQEFNLEVLVPPQLETEESQRIVKHEGDNFVLTCPVRRSQETGNPQILWYKDNRPVDTSGDQSIKLSNDGKRLHVLKATLTDAGNYSCVALNRAGEASIYFIVEILSSPRVFGTNNDLQPHVMVGRPITLWCTATGHPFPTIRWFKDGKEETSNLDNGIRLEIVEAQVEHSGIWLCEAENDAGKSELAISLDVWTPPTVQVSPEKAVLPLDSLITLMCIATGNPPPGLNWNKDGQPLVSSVDGARISLKGTRLDIPRLQQSHVGQYSCAAHNEAGNAESTVFVDVLVPPVINRDGIDMSPRLPVTHTPTLYCEASGKPFPEIQWYFNNTIIDASLHNILIGEGGRYIQISNISLADRGLYKCVATNVAGFDELIYTVAIFQAPSILNGGIQQAIEGKVATMTCNAIGEPTPLIQWQRNGVLLDTEPRYIVEEKMLTINDARSSDSGIYLCTAANEAGTAHQAFTLEVLVPPRITSMSPSESLVKSNTPFSLKCGARGDPNPEISWLLNAKSINDEVEGYNIADDGTLFVTKADPDKVYKFTCVARNGAGQDQKDYAVRTMSPPNVPANAKKITINATEGVETQLYCQVAGEKAQLSWFRKGFPLVLTRNMSLTSDGTILKFHSTRLGDEGLYSCVATNFAGNASQEFQLFVGTPPRIEASSLKVEANAGEDPVLECEAVGIPLPKITWLKNEVVMSANEAQKGSKSRLKFSKVTNEDSAVYTCSAENWAGHTYKDINLVVFVPPKVFPERLDVTARLAENVILPCNATGIPEPIITWVKTPNIKIHGNTKKHQILGTSLFIQNVETSDEGLYQCSAGTSAGLAKGIRNLKIVSSSLADETPTKQIWVKCDEDGNPIVDSYVQDRGDVPEEQDNMLPTGRHQIDVGMDGKSTKRCLYTPRGTRTLSEAPYISEPPISQMLRPGMIAELHCRAEGYPQPKIRWLKDNEPIEEVPDKIGFSTLHINIEKPEDPEVAGMYTCVADNGIGKAAKADAVLEFENRLESSSLRYRNRFRNVMIFNCIERGKPQTESVLWQIDGEPVDRNDKMFNVMSNGSLVVFDAEEISFDELGAIDCYRRGRSRSKQYALQSVVEGLPKVVIHMKKFYTQVGENIVIDCHLHSEPLTTKVQWFKNNLPLITEDQRIRILPNNSLSIKSLRPADHASYTCRGTNRLGESADEVEVIVQDGPEKIVGFIGGRINNRQVTNQPLFIDVTPNLQNNAVFIKIDNLLNNRDPAAKAVVGYTSALCPMIAYNRNYEGLLDKSLNFERYTDYKFETGENLRVKQTGDGLNGAYLKMDVLVDGTTPHSNFRDMVTFDDLEEDTIETEPGRIKGHGKSTLLINRSTRIPFHWNHSTSYDASKGMRLGPGQTLNLKLKTETIGNMKGYKVDATAQRLNQCPEGFEKMPNGYCEDINECEADPTLCGEASCINDEGSYRCVRECEPGYKVKWDGTCVDIDECLLGTHNCLQGKQCLNLPGSFSCEDECAEGFFMNAKGQCEDIDECASSPCESPMTCLNQMGSHLCLCPSGLPESKNGGCRGIQIEAENLSRLVESDENNNDCPEGYTWNGVHCEDIDECAFDSPCQYICHNIPGSYYCECPRGYVLEDNECIDVDECADNPCESGQLCFNHIGSYECIKHPCPNKYLLKQMECLPDCQNCTLPPIRIHFVTLPKGIKSSTSLLRLTAYDTHWRILPDTKFSIKAVPRFLTRPPFILKTNRGRAILQNTRPLLVNNRYKLGIKAVSKSPYTNSRFQSEFLVFISVSGNGF